MDARNEWNDLQATLEHLVNAYQRLLDMSKRQKNLLIENKVEELSSLLQEMGTLTDNIFVLDDRRRMHMELLSEGASMEILTLQELAKYWPDFDSTEIFASADKLRTIRTDLIKVTKLNTALTLRAQSYVQSMVNLLVRIPGKGNTRPKVYDAKGKLNRSKPAVRNLLNRRG